MNHLHWMKFYIGDELSNTAHMMPAEFGSYIYLKMHYWRFGCLPTDDERLARIAKVTVDQWNDIKPSIGPLFEDGWRDPKLEEQRAEAEEAHQKRVDAGKKGGRPRREEKQSLSIAKAKPKQPEPEPEPYLESKPAPEPEPEGLAYEKGKRDTNTRESMFTPFPIPSSVANALQFLEKKGVPQPKLDECARLMMGGNFSPFDLEGVISEGRDAA